MGRIFLSLVAVAGAASLRFDAELAKKNPVAQVLQLLQGMEKQLEKEGQEDEAAFKKMDCWCKTNIKEKSASANGAGAKAEQLKAKVKELAATAVRLDTEVKGLSEEVAKNTQSLVQATELRSKQQAQFQAEEKDLVSSIQAVKGAIVTLSKGKKDKALMQLPALLARNADVLQGMITPVERRTLEVFIEVGNDQKPSATSEVLGVLKQMSETFATNLENAKKEDAKSQQTFQGLRDAKKSEIDAAKSQIEAKKQERADTDLKLAQSKQDIEDSAGNAAKDAEFLKTLEVKCKKSSEDWQRRQKDRAEEVGAVTQAVSMLSSDDARDTFKKSLSLLEVQTSAEAFRRNKAVKILADAAKRLEQPSLALLASSAKLDNFEKVKKAIDDMAEALAKEQVDEAKKKEFCLAEISANKAKRQAKAQDKAGHEARAEDQKQTVTKAADSITTNTKTVQELNLQLKKAQATREKTQKDLADVVADQRQTQQLLQKAITVLKDFYSKHPAPAPKALVQSATSEEPAGLKEYKKSGASAGVVALLEHILEDSKKAEQAALKSDKDSEATFQAVVKETKASVDARTEDSTNKASIKAQAEGDLIQTKETIHGVEGEIHTLIQTRDQLHMTCDFLVQNFNLRKDARTQEIESLKEAKAVLSGAKLGFLQK